MTFECVRKKGKKTERWKGVILGLRKYASHYEFRIESRSGIMVVIGKTICGWFACMPDFGAGCHLSTLDDKFWNTERLIEVLGEVDGITVASALHALSGTIDL
ncbi:MAG TPA: hypothetical protein PK568_10045 [Bacillota bacterium]|jgi:hypothetical protein|nr:hypothetical protein [Bacillota bacterium]HPU02210.1 hypothetical protein [Bacillota bacterium]